MPVGQSRGVPNPNNSSESEFIRKQIVPFPLNQREILNIRIPFLTNRIGVCSILIHSVNESNNNQIFQSVKNINEASTLKVILNISNFQPKNLILKFYMGTYSTNKLIKSYVGYKK